MVEDTVCLKMVWKNACSNDIGSKKGITLARNLKQECIAATEIRGYAFRFEEAVTRRINLSCDVVIYGADNNPASIAVSRYSFTDLV